jgi:acyl-CoA hydrolase
MPLLFRRGILPIDVALISVSPPDAHGYCSLGTSVDITVGALESARYVLAEVNPQVPRTHGDGVIHWRELDAVVYTNTPVAREHAKTLSAEEIQIGKNIAALVEDGATLQMGIGAIPDAVLSQLIHHRKLGIHTEMFSDGLLPLLELGAVTGENKKILPGKVVATFAMGSEKLMCFVDDNPSVLFRDAAFTNDTATIRKNPKVTAINSAIEIDLTGQVCADSIGPMQFSGVGGQMDFIRGASLSEGGKPILALTSTTRRGENKIVPFLKEGASVTTTRAHVHWVVTEFGSVNLYGLNLRQRAKALIALAHPTFREHLEKEAWNRLHR